MFFVKHVVAAALAALVALPFAACGGGGGTSGTCADFCKGTIACTGSAGCTLQDPGGAQDACAEMCDSGFAALTDAEAKLVDDCLSCIVQATPAGQCLQLEKLPDACKAMCTSDATAAAANKWSEASASKSGDPRGLCTNGRNILGESECQGTGDETSCSILCCNGKCGASPDAGVTCDTTASPVTCTCTAGKNKGKTFTPAGMACDANELWDQCGG